MKHVPLLVVGCLACKSPQRADLQPVPVSDPKPRSDADAAKTEPPPVTPSNADMPPGNELRSLASASNAFAFDLWGRARAQPGNLALSPASITTALAMTWSGARGTTATQLRDVLHLEGEVDRTTAAWGKLAAALQSPTRELELRMANRLFGDKAYRFEPAFLELTKHGYGAALDPVDFAGGPDAARARINAWIAGQTKDRITNLLPPTSITDRTRLVLVNAIYFLADWQAQFGAAWTRDVEFAVAPTTKHPVPTMHQVALFRYAKAEGVSMLELPYRGGDAAMLVVLPDQRDGLGAVERSLDAGKLAAWTAALRAHEVQVALPRFTVDPAEPVELSRHLIALGVKDAFDAGRADFAGIAAAADPAQRLYITQVFHKAFVKVDEHGTEAAGATAVVAAPTGAAPRPAVEFKADHPFLFFIVDNASGLVLFMGRVADPAAR